MDQYSVFEMSLSEFRKEIERKHNYLVSYSKKPNANPEFLKNESENLSLLVNVYNGLESQFHFIEPLLPVCQEFWEIQNRDRELGIVQLDIYTNPYKKNRGLIIYNPFSNDRF